MDGHINFLNSMGRIVNNKWIDIDKQLPRPYSEVLLYIPCNRGPSFEEGSICVATFDRKNCCFLLDSVKEMQQLADYINGSDYISEKKPIQLINFPVVYLSGVNFEPSHWQYLPSKPSLYSISKRNFIFKFCQKLGKYFE